MRISTERCGNRVARRERVTDKTFSSTAKKRSAEAMAGLTVGDYDPSEQTLLIRASKFHKSRRLPLSSDAQRELARHGKPRLGDDRKHQGHLGG